MVIVTAKVVFFIDRVKRFPGDKITVTKEKAQELADRGFVKSMNKPIIDKMIREPKKEK